MFPGQESLNTTGQYPDEPSPKIQQSGILSSVFKKNELKSEEVKKFRPASQIMRQSVGDQEMMNEVE